MFTSQYVSQSSRALKKLTGLGVIAALSLQCAAQDTILAPVPSGFQNVSVVLIKNNLAVIPEPWDNSNIPFTAFYDITTNNTAVRNSLDKVKAANFIAFDTKFFDVIGQSAKIEKLLDFPASPNSHEAPVYYPPTNELIFSDTGVTGWLYAVNAKTNAIRNLTTTPPLADVNGGTIHKGKVYFTTNGGPIRAVYQVDPVSGNATLVVNNYRGRKLNSPNDIIADSSGNLWFTDPAYGWSNGFAGVDYPQLPNSVYFFNITSGALQAVTNNVVLYPNGLALSKDEKTLYIADSNSTSGRPNVKQPASVRNVYAFDVDGTILSNPRIVNQNEVGWPDGLRVTQSGLLIVAGNFAADVIDPTTGALLGKFNAPDDVIFNVEPIPGTGTWFLTGARHLYKVTIKEKALVK